MGFKHLWQKVRRLLVFLIASLVTITLFNAIERQSAALAGSELPRSALSTRPQNLVDSIGQRLVVGSADARVPGSYSFKIFETDAMSNAFIMPGGGVFITRGLYNRLETEAELAAILSHELGHFLAEHTRSAALGSGLPLDLSYGEAVWPLAAQTVEEEELQMKRQSELEADFFGMCILSAAGYDPAAMYSAIRILTDSQDPAARAAAEASTHPDPAQRLAQIQTNLAHLDTCP